MALRKRHKGDAISPQEPSRAVANASDTASPLQDPGRDSAAILDTFLGRLESGLERFERALTDSATEPDEMPPTPDKGPAQRVIADAADTFAKEQLALLLEQVETSARRLESLVADMDSRFKEWLAAARDGGPVVTSSEPFATADTTEVLRSVREGIAGLVRGVDGEAPASGDLEAWLAAVRDLRARLANYVEQ